MEVPFFDINRMHKPIQQSIHNKFKEVLESGSFILGDFVESFENEFAAYIGTKFACGVDNGTSALELILRALDIKEGDEVITSPASFISSSSAIAFTGAEPVFVDIDPKTYNINPELIKKKITFRTKAILPIHLYGQPSDMSEINLIAKEFDLLVIEDACEAHGAKYKENKVGSLGIAAAFSFYPSKNLGALGDGGIITSSSESLISKVKALRNYSQSKKYHHDEIAFNRRLDAIQAAILSVKLPLLNKHNEQRIEAAKLYDDFLQNSKIIIPKVGENRNHVYYAYVIQSQKRDELSNFLREDGIETGKHFPTSIHLQKAFYYLDYEEGSFPEAEKLSGRCLSLPIFPGITEEEIKYVSNKILEFERK